MIPLNPIRKIIIAEDSSCHISMEAVMVLRDVIEELARDIVNGALQEFQKRNSNRARQGLHPLKRIDAWAIKEANAKVLKQQKDNHTGSQPAMIGGPGGKKMSTQTKATKSAKEETRNNGDNNGL